MTRFHKIGILAHEIQPAAITHTLASKKSTRSEPQLGDRSLGTRRFGLRREYHCISFTVDFERRISTHSPHACNPTCARSCLRTGTYLKRVAFASVQRRAHPPHIGRWAPAISKGGALALGRTEGLMRFIARLCSGRPHFLVHYRHRCRRHSHQRQHHYHLVSRPHPSPYAWITTLIATSVTRPEARACAVTIERTCTSDYA
jgi:hypothetical protein